MRLDVSKALAAEGREIPFAVEVDLPDTTVLGETVTFARPARLEGFYTSVGEAIRVHGRLTFTATSGCVRCLRVASHGMETAFDVVYTLEEHPENPDLYRYDGAWIDPTDMAADAALLALPMQWHCREDCLGLCPQCGVDRNADPCSCRMEEKIDHPFSALQQLLTKDESEV